MKSETEDLGEASETILDGCFNQAITWYGFSKEKFIELCYKYSLTGDFWDKDLTSSFVSKYKAQEFPLGGLMKDEGEGLENLVRSILERVKAPAVMWEDVHALTWIHEEPSEGEAEESEEETEEGSEESSEDED